MRTAPFRGGAAKERSCFAHSPRKGVNAQCQRLFGVPATCIVAVHASCACWASCALTATVLTSLALASSIDKVAPSVHGRYCQARRQLHYLSVPTEQKWVG
jgi:hypothetical protein